MSHLLSRHPSTLEDRPQANSAHALVQRMYALGHIYIYIYIRRVQQVVSPCISQTSRIFGSTYDRYTGRTILADLCKPCECYPCIFMSALYTRKPPLEYFHKADVPSHLAPDEPGRGNAFALLPFWDGSTYRSALRRHASQCSTT